MAHALCMLKTLGYTRTQTQTHTHTHKEYVTLISFPWQKWLLERAQVLGHKYVRLVFR